jgi:ribose-5-phosphate isomerase B
MKIVIGNDHAGTHYKEAIIAFLKKENYEVINVGTDLCESVDYPDFAHPVGELIDKGEAQVGILICGSGNGVAMTANKHARVRCAVCWTKEIASLARLHNDANVISIPARFTAIEQAIEMVKTFLTTEFEGGRHSRRVEKI